MLLDSTQRIITQHQTTIAKEFRWEMGHRLPFHAGLCKNIHGHSYRLRVEVEGSLDENGMVIDFYDLNTVVEPIIEQLDHSFICDTSDTVMANFFQEHSMKVVWIPQSTTAENICRWILEQVCQSLSVNKRLTKVTCRLHETERAFAECTMVL